MSFRKKIANFFYGIGNVFESARISMSRGNPNTINPSDATVELPSYTQTELVRKARYLEKNSGHIRRLLRDLKVYGIGKGIFPSAKSDMDVSHINSLHSCVAAERKSYIFLIKRTNVLL